MKFLVIIERGQRNYGAYSPDLPGCIATGRTRREVSQRMREAVRLHLEGLRRHGLPVPRPSASVEVVEVA